LVLSVLNIWTYKGNKHKKKNENTEREKTKQFAFQRTNIWSSIIQELSFKMPMVFFKVLHRFIFARNQGVFCNLNLEHVLIQVLRSVL